VQFAQKSGEIIFAAGYGRSGRGSETTRIRTANWISSEFPLKKRKRWFEKRVQNGAAGQDGFAQKANLTTKEH
jgi:hypothetical protein